MSFWTQNELIDLIRTGMRYQPLRYPRLIVGRDPDGRIFGRTVVEETLVPVGYMRRDWQPPDLPPETAEEFKERMLARNKNPLAVSNVACKN